MISIATRTAALCLHQALNCSIIRLFHHWSSPSLGYSIVGIAALLGFSIIGLTTRLSPHGHHKTYWDICCINSSSSANQHSLVFHLALIYLSSYKVLLCCALFFYLTSASKTERDITIFISRLYFIVYSREVEIELAINPLVMADQEMK